MNKINRSQIIEDLKRISEMNDEVNYKENQDLLKDYYESNMAILELHPNILVNVAYTDIKIYLSHNDLIYIERQGEVFLTAYQKAFLPLLNTLEMVNGHLLNGIEYLLFKTDTGSYNIETEKVFNDFIDELNTILFYATKNFYMIDEEVSDKNLCKLYSVVTQNLSLL